MLCHYSDTIVPDVKNNITYNDETNLLLNGNLGMSCMKIKKKIHWRRWNYNDVDVDVDITWWCQVGEHQYDGSFKTMNNSFIQNGLNMMVLYASRQSNSLGVPTSS
jgi:lysozyme family protein